MNNNNFKIYQNEKQSWGTRGNRDLEPEEELLFNQYITQPRNALEVGTGSGRLLFALETRWLPGQELLGVDFSPKMIAAAAQNAKDKNSLAKFEVMDAIDLSQIEANHFFYLIYQQQILSFIPEEKINQALSEAHRILSPSGYILISVLNYDERKYNKYLSKALNVFRALRHETLSEHALPWLKFDNHKLNWKLFCKNQALNYWFTQEDLYNRLTAAGFKNITIKTKNQLLNTSGSPGRLYAICTK